MEIDKTIRILMSQLSNVQVVLNQFADAIEQKDKRIKELEEKSKE